MQAWRLAASFLAESARQIPDPAFPMNGPFATEPAPVSMGS